MHKIKKFFGFTFDPSSQPGYQSRFSRSETEKTQVGKIKQSVVEFTSLPEIDDNAYREFNSRQIKEVNPTPWLRKRGYEV